MGVVHIHVQATDAYADLDSWLHRWEPRLKLAAGLVFVLGVALMESLLPVTAALGVAVLAALSSRIPMRFVAARLLWVLPFLTLMVVTLALGSGWPPSAAGLSFALLVALKALTALTVLVTLLGTQPLQTSLGALAHLRLPPLVVLALFLAYRYLFLFRDELQAARRSLVARAFRPGLNGYAFRAYGELTGTLLLRAMDRSDNVYRAMAARGFDGRLHTGQARSLEAADLAKGALSLAVVALLVTVDRGILL